MNPHQALQIFLIAADLVFAARWLYDHLPECLIQKILLFRKF